MPISRLSFVRATLLLLVVGVLALVGILGTTIWLVGRTQSYADEVARTRLIRSAAVDLLAIAQDAETGQRGYLLTGEASYLTPFEASAQRLAPGVARLREGTKSSPEQAEQVERVATLLAAKFAELNQTVDLAKAGNRDAAVAIVRGDTGKALMDEAREVFRQIISTAENALNARVAEQRQSANALWWVAIVGAFIILGVTLVGAWTILRYTRELGEAQTEVAALNVGLEERVRERTAELGRANEEIQRFAYIVTHDLRAPLVNIMGFTSELETSLATLQHFIANGTGAGDPSALAEAKRASEEDLPEALGFIRSSTRKMDGLINAILKLSREGRRTLRPETIDLSGLLAAGRDSLSHQLIESEGQVDLDIAIPPLISDRLSLEQIFGNLLDNAVKYRAPGRPLRIKVTGRPARGDRVVIDVEDNGRGIAEQDHERVFELFRRSGTQDRPGEGIGLAHVRTLVRNLGGEITLSSRFGQGTTFSISLPRDVRAFVGSKAT